MNRIQICYSKSLGHFFRFCFGQISVWAILLFSLIGPISCRDDFERISHSAQDQPSFSADTVLLDTLFSRLSSATHELKIYNRNKSSIRLDRIALESGNRGYRINVDGRSGDSFPSMIILPGDSMYVFVEATFPEGEDDLPGEITDKLLVECRGVQSSVLLRGFRLNADRVGALIIERDTTLSLKRPLLVRDSIVVASQATLTIQGGGRLCFYPKAYMGIHGRLIAEGQRTTPIRMEGERQDRLLEDLPYPLVPGQWGGVYFGKSSHGNRMTYCELRNAVNGIVFDGVRSPEEMILTMENSLVSNIKGYGLVAEGGRLELSNSEISNTLNTSLLLNGSSCLIRSCSFVNFYPWDNRGGPTILYTDVISHDEAGNPIEKPLPTPGSSFEMISSVVDGSRATRVSPGSIPNDNMGELILRLVDSTALGQSIHISHSFLRIPEAYHVNSAMKDCLLPKDDKPADLKKDRYYLSLGYDNKPVPERNFRYDFRPFPTAPFVGKGMFLDTWPVDRTGVARSGSPTAGCYEPEQSAEK